MLDTKGESQESVFTSLSILGDTGFEFTNTSGDDKDGAISLGGTSNHVLDEITVTWGVNDGDVVLKKYVTASTAKHYEINAKKSNLF